MELDGAAYHMMARFKLNKYSASTERTQVYGAAQVHLYVLYSFTLSAKVVLVPILHHHQYARVHLVINGALFARKFNLNRDCVRTCHQICTQWSHATLNHWLRRELSHIIYICVKTYVNFRLFAKGVTSAFTCVPNMGTHIESHPTERRVALHGPIYWLAQSLCVHAWRINSENESK